MQRRWTLLVLALALALAASAACGSSSADGDGLVAPPATGEPSSPFEVGHVPPGFVLDGVGRGSAEQSWGDDSTGSDEPITLLERDGARASVSLTGYEGNQGGFLQASAGYVCHGGRPPERLRVDGRRAAFTPAASDCRESDELLVDRGDDLAVRVVAEGLTQDQLVDLARDVRPSSDRGRAPSVTPPEGWRVTGHADVDLVLAVKSSGRMSRDGVTTEHLPGPPSAHVMTWHRAESYLAVLTLPGTDPRGLLGLAGYHVVVEDDEMWVEAQVGRTLVKRAPWGDLLVVWSQLPGLEKAELRAVADSVEAVDAATWDATIAETGGDELRVAPHSQEVTRGPGWLLQARPTELLPGAYDVDECLVLPRGRRACADSLFGVGAGTSVRYAEPEEGKPGFVLVSVQQPGGGEVRVEAGGQVARSPLVRLPGEPAIWAAVVLVDRPGLPGCGQAAPPDLEVMRVDLIAPDGSARCLRP